VVVVEIWEFECFEFFFDSYTFDAYPENPFFIFQFTFKFNLLSSCIQLSGTWVGLGARFKNIDNQKIQNLASWIDT